MRVQTIIFTAIIIVLTIDAFGQVSITNQCNGYRDGDKIYRVVTESVSPGNRGENSVWKIPPIQKENDFVIQTVFRNNDSITIAEGDFLLHYISTENELSMCGFQKRGMYGVHNKLLPELKFPFAYGDSISGTYSRKTTYYDMFSIEGEGTCYTVCDGMGILTDGQEILKDVLRVHHHNTIVSKYGNQDGDDSGPSVVEVTEDKYLWYCPGCRYPVMDTRILRSKSNGKIVSDSTFTSLYLPDLQSSDLAYDEDNSPKIAKNGKIELQETQNDDGRGSLFPIKMSAELQLNNGNVRLNYQVSTELKDCAFYAYDLAGRLLGSVVHKSLGEGEYSETLLLTSHPIGEIVMLSMVVGDDRQVVKVR